MTLRFEPTLRQAWLVDLDDGATRTQGDLCRRHAEALVLPRGWKLHDERSERGPGAAEQSAAAPARPRRVRVPRRSGVSAAPPPTRLPGFETGDPAPNGQGVIDADDADDLDEPDEIDEPDEPDDLDEIDDSVAPDDAGGGTIGPAPEQPAAEPVSTGRSIPAQFGANDDDEGADEVDESLDAILDARTPLLQRAFRNTPRNT